MGTQQPIGCSNKTLGGESNILSRKNRGKVKYGYGSVYVTGVLPAPVDSVAVGSLNFFGWLSVTKNQFSKLSATWKLCKILKANFDNAMGPMMSFFWQYRANTRAILLENWTKGPH